MHDLAGAVSAVGLGRENSRKSPSKTSQYSQNPRVLLYKFWYVFRMCMKFAKNRTRVAALSEDEPPLWPPGRYLVDSVVLEHLPAFSSVFVSGRKRSWRAFSPSLNKLKRKRRDSVRKEETTPKSGPRGSLFSESPASTTFCTLHWISERVVC